MSAGTEAVSALWQPATWMKNALDVSSLCQLEEVCSFFFVNYLVILHVSVMCKVDFMCVCPPKLANELSINRLVGIKAVVFLGKPL